MADKRKIERVRKFQEKFEKENRFAGPYEWVIAFAAEEVEKARREEREKEQRNRYVPYL